MKTRPFRSEYILKGTFVTITHYLHKDMCMLA